MADASYLQSNFLGGEWSKYMQGRMDRQDYRSALALAYNWLPVEEGALVRRPGTQFVALTRTGAPAVLREFHFSQLASYNVEFSANHIRIFNGPELALDDSWVDVTSISTATPAVVLTAAPTTWATGDSVKFGITPLYPTTPGGMLDNRVFQITVIDSTHFSLHDEATNDGIDGTTIDISGGVIQVTRVTDFASPYSGSLDSIRLVQTEDTAVILEQGVPPHQLKSLTDGDRDSETFATFALSQCIFSDGPYNDAPTDGATLSATAIGGTTNGYTILVTYPLWDSTVVYQGGDVVDYKGVAFKSLIPGNVNKTPTYPAGDGNWQAQADNNPGNLPPWNSVTSYATAQGVFYNGARYLSLISPNLNHTPSGATDANWQIERAYGPVRFVDTDVGRMIRIYSQPDDWAVGTTYAVNDIVFYGDIPWICLTANTGSQPGINVINWVADPAAAAWNWGVITNAASVTPYSIDVQMNEGPLLYPAGTIDTYRIGAYSDTTGWPTCGTYHEGRLWLSGAQGNRIDGSVSNDPFNFSPTAPDGTVADNNAIDAVVESTDINSVFWMLPTAVGIICGTQGGEWLIQASQLSDPLTPTSIQAHRATKYGCENVEPRDAGIATVFIQRYGRKLIEYVADAYTGKFSGTNLSLPAKHLTLTGIQEMAYVRETTPIMWLRMMDGSLAAMTYRRDSRFSSQPADFSGWSSHQLATGRIVTSLQAGPSQDGNTDSLMMVTVDPTGGNHYVELLTTIFAEGDDARNAWEVDCGVKAEGFNLVTVGLNDYVQFYGFAHLEGDTIDVWGSKTGAADLDLGTATVTNGAILILKSKLDPVIDEVYEVLGGRSITSQAQMLRPIAPQETGAQNGPSLGKTRRAHQYAMLLQDAWGVSVGTDFDHLNPIEFQDARGTALPMLPLFSGINWTTIDDDYSFDSQVCWQVDRPYPAAILAVEVFLHTQDR